MEFFRGYTRQLGIQVYRGICCRRQRLHCNRLDLGDLSSAPPTRYVFSYHHRYTLKLFLSQIVDL
jgi:hypothetical protein